MKNFLLKEKHLLISMAIGIVCLISLVLGNILWGLKIISMDLNNSLLTTSGVFIGFVITALGIYYSVTLRDEIKSTLIKQGYYKQISRNFIIGMFLFVGSVVFSILSICLFNEEGCFVIQHVLSSINISLFLTGLVILLSTSINLFKVLVKN